MLSEAPAAGGEDEDAIHPVERRVDRFRPLEIAFGELNLIAENLARPPRIADERPRGLSLRQELPHDAASDLPGRSADEDHPSSFP